MQTLRLVKADLKGQLKYTAGKLRSLDYMAVTYMNRLDAHILFQLSCPF